MKNKSIGSLILLAILAPACGGGGGGGGGSKRSITPPRWEEVYRKPTSVDLRAVRFGNANQGIAAGKFGTFVRTNDGGNTWSQLESTPVTLNGDILAMAVSNTTTFAVGGAPQGAGAYTSSVAWQSLDATTFHLPEPSVPFSEEWVDVGIAVPATNQFPSATVRLRPSGLVDLYQGALNGTRNSATNDPAGSPPFSAPWLRASGLATFGTSSLLLVCGDNGSGATTGGQIRRNKNDEAFWDTLNIVGGSPPLNRFWMLDELTGFVCGDDNTILFTVNTVDWNPIGNKPGTLPSGKLRGIQFLNATLGWVVGDAGRIIRLRNVSSTWNWDVQTSNTGQDLYDVCFVSADIGYAVGNNGVVVKTSNGSATTPTWTVMTTPVSNPTPNFNAVDFTANGGLGLAVGDSGTLMRSTDGGATWSSFATGVAAANLTAVSIPRQGSNTVAYVGTDSGALFFNNDIQGTGTWQAGSASLGAGVKTILFPKGDASGLAAGASGQFARLAFANPTLTVTVQALPSAPAGTMYSAACDPTGNTLYLGGDNGYLVTSTDGGATWAPVASTNATPSVSFRALQAPTGTTTTLFAGASDDKVYLLSTGAPGTWSAPASTLLGTPASLAFIDENLGWVVTQGATGGVLFTVDGGVNWFRSLLHVPVDATAAHTLNAIWMHPSQTGFVVGGNGVIIRTTTGGQ